MIRVLIADDQGVIRSALTALVAAEPDIEVVGQAADGTAAVAQARRLRPDVVLMDIQMPGIDGLAATREIRALDTDIAVIVLTTYDLDAYVFQAVRAGAAGFLLKDGDADTLINGIRSAAAGDALMSPAALRRLFTEFAATPVADPTAARSLERLTDRERDVLRLAATGKNNTEIADQMFLGVATVKSHVSGILAKLDVRDRTQAVVIAFQGGLLSTHVPPVRHDSAG
jgi:DNA-binding NarL/FixJ family response regulator